MGKNTTQDANGTADYLIVLAMPTQGLGFVQMAKGEPMKNQLESLWEGILGIVLLAVIVAFIKSCFGCL